MELPEVPRITAIDYEAAMDRPAPVVEAPKKKKKLTKAEKKAKKIKAAQDFRKLEMRDHLRRELELSKKSCKRGLSEWQDMCKEIKLMELREELQYWAEKSARMMQRKDEKIEMMLDEMDSISEMHKKGFARHVQIMDYISDVFCCFIAASKQIYEYNCETAIIDFQEELNYKNFILDYAKRNREDIMHGTNWLFEKDLATDLKIYQEKQDDRVNSEIAKRYQVRDAVIDEMKKLRRQLLHFITTLQNTELDPHKYERITSLMERQRIFVIEAQKLNELEFRHTRRYGELQRELLHLETEGQRRLNDLRLEQNYFLHVRKGIEMDIKTNRAETFERLRLFTSEGYSVMERYKKLEKYGELLLSLSGSCRKLQTEREKVVPWGDFIEPKEIEEEEGAVGGAPKEVREGEDSEFIKEHFKLQCLDLAKHLDLSEEDLAKQAKLLKNFWRRVAIVEMQNMLLMEEKRRLTEDNAQYCERIRALGSGYSDVESELLAAVTYTPLHPEEVPCRQFFQRKKLSIGDSTDLQLETRSIKSRLSNTSVVSRRTNSSKKSLGRFIREEAKKSSES